MVYTSNGHIIQKGKPILRSLFDRKATYIEESAQPQPPKQTLRTCPALQAPCQTSPGGNYTHKSVQPVIPKTHTGKRGGLHIHLQTDTIFRNAPQQKSHDMSHDQTRFVKEKPPDSSLSPKCSEEKQSKLEVSTSSQVSGWQSYLYLYNSSFNWLKNTE